MPVPEEELPVELPEVENYEPTGTGESPLAVIDDWVNVPRYDIASGQPAEGGWALIDENTRVKFFGQWVPEPGDQIQKQRRTRGRSLRRRIRRARLGRRRVGPRLYGRVGLGTSVPYVELHIVDGDTPTVRLDQDGSAGWTAQRWDVAGNETNFFIRDATNGSRLPFRIFPGAPSNSLKDWH